jgi:hypothetical protein
MLAFGVAGGIALTAVLTGTSADDPCFGSGRLDRKIVGPPEEGSKEFSVCTRLGRETIIDASGTPVVQTFRDEEIVEYYKTHPAENPLVIADQTEDARIAVEGFVTPTIPPFQAGEDCPPGTARTSLSSVNATICLPPDWKVDLEDPTGIRVASAAGSATVAIFSDQYQSHVTACANPVVIAVPIGDALVCQQPTDPWGTAGYGITLPNGIRVGVEVNNKASEEDASLAFSLAMTARR